MEGRLIDLLERVRATGLLGDEGRVVVLLSGGRDSVCLLDVAARIGGDVVALHVNYGLREEAAADQALCRQVCARLAVPLEVVAAGAPEGNVQAWAREVRYAEAAALAERRGALVAAGHTAGDQAETILYRLASSPSRRALLGMAPRDGRLVRPLLGVTREDTRGHCLTRGLTWADDASNDSDAYARGRVRGGLVSALEAVHPAAQRNVVRAAQTLREEAAVLDEIVDTALAGRSYVTLGHLRILPPALGRLVLRRLAEDATGSLCPRVSARFEEVLELDDHAMLDLGDGARAVVRAGTLRFERTPPLPVAG